MDVALRRSAARDRRDAGHGARWNGALLIVLTGLLTGLGTIALFSASALLEPPGRIGFTGRQLIGTAAGVAVMMIVARQDYRRLRTVAWPAMLGAIGLLTLLVLPWSETIAPTINGARRWLSLGVTFQPAEFVKLALVVWAATIAVRKGDGLRESFEKGLLPFLCVGGVVIGLVALQPDFSSAAVLALLLGLIVFAAGARTSHLAGVAVATLPLVLMVVRGAGYRWDRVTAFLSPTADPAGISYQVQQSLIAVGSGGWTGVGFGRSEQKIGFLPEPHNDFIFATIAEEWGLLGVAVFVILLGLFGTLGLRIAARARETFGYLLAIGMTAVIVIPAVLHIAVVLAVMPATGIPLPFVSYGRSSLIVAFAAVGVLLAVHRGSMIGQEVR